MPSPSDLDIARSVTPRPIDDIAAELGLRPDEIERYGATKAKVTLEAIARVERENPRGKYVVMTAITPTPLGEGKTTTTVGLTQGLGRIGRKASWPSASPRWARPSASRAARPAAGTARSSPWRTSTSTSPGISTPSARPTTSPRAFLDNHLDHGNKLDIDPYAIRWPRVVDMNDRALRKINIGLGGKTNGVPRESGFDITVASEVMAILALATDVYDLRARLGRIVLATDRSGTPVTTEDLGVAGAMTVLLLGRHHAEPPADARGAAGLRALRALREHRPRQLLHPRRPRGARTSEIRGHRERLRRGHGHREVLRHQVPRLAAWRPDAPWSWRPCGRSRCTAAGPRSSPGKPLDPALLEENPELVRTGGCQPGRTRRDRRASTAYRWSWPSTPSPATPTRSARRSARWRSRPARRRGGDHALGRRRRRCRGAGRRGRGRPRRRTAAFRCSIPTRCPWPRRSRRSPPRSTAPTASTSRRPQRTPSPSTSGWASATCRCA